MGRTAPAVADHEDRLARSSVFRSSGKKIGSRAKQIALIPAIERDAQEEEREELASSRRGSDSFQRVPHHAAPACPVEVEQPGCLCSREPASAVHELVDRRTRRSRGASVPHRRRSTRVSHA